MFIRLKRGREIVRNALELGVERTSASERPPSRGVVDILFFSFLRVLSSFLYYRLALDTTHLLLVAALQELIEENVTSVLPALECLLVERLNLSGSVRTPTPEDRRASLPRVSSPLIPYNYPIAVSHWNGVAGFVSDMFPTPPHLASMLFLDPD
jgi:hypothetical protein